MALLGQSHKLGSPWNPPLLLPNCNTGPMTIWQSASYERTLAEDTSTLSQMLLVFAEKDQEIGSTGCFVQPNKKRDWC
jgi:hypothetical protein